MKDIKRVLAPAFRKVFPADFEDWMERMASEGWHVDRIGQWSSLLMTFRKGEPKKYRFVYDIQPFPGKDYRETYEQFGWEHVGIMASVHIWRMEYSAERPEAFSDAESIASRNRRTVLAVSVSFTIFLLFALAMAVLLIFFPGSLSAGDRAQFLWAGVFSFVMAALLGFVMFFIIKKSKNNPGRRI